MKTVLFLCTGNYYRSRFAEELFNHHAARAELDYLAQSRGLALERGINNVGSMSRFARDACEELAIVPRGADRLPQQCSVNDLASAKFVIAVNEPEHRPLMRERFRNWEQSTEYWNVQDIDVARPTDALKSLAQEVRTLLLRCAKGRFR